MPQLQQPYYVFKYQYENPSLYEYNCGYQKQNPFKIGDLVKASINISYGHAPKGGIKMDGETGITKGEIIQVIDVSKDYILYETDSEETPIAMAKFELFDLVSSKCTCRFYDMEVFGCQCGKFLS